MGPTTEYIVVTKDLLVKKLAVLPGGYDVDNCPIIWCPSIYSIPRLTDESYRTTISYLIASSEFECSSRFTFLVDLRELGLGKVEQIINIIRKHFTTYTQQVVIVQDASFGEPQITKTKDKGFDIVTSTIQALPSLIEIDQLPVEFAGTMEYDHAIWLYNKLGYLWHINESNVGDIKEGRPGTITLKVIENSEYNNKYRPIFQNITLVDVGYPKAPGERIELKNLPEVEKRLRPLCEEAYRKRIFMAKNIGKAKQEHDSELRPLQKIFVRLYRQALH